MGAKCTPRTSARIRVTGQDALDDAARKRRVVDWAVGPPVPAGGLPRGDTACSFSCSHPGRYGPWYGTHRSVPGANTCSRYLRVRHHDHRPQSACDTCAREPVGIPAAECRHSLGAATCARAESTTLRMVVARRMSGPGPRLPVTCAAMSSPCRRGIGSRASPPSPAREWTATSPASRSCARVAAESLLVPPGSDYPPLAEAAMWCSSVSDASR